MMGSKLSYALMACLLMGVSGVKAGQQNQVETTINPTAVHVKNLSQEQARQAILKMAGEFKVNFRFEEIYAQKSNYSLKQADISNAYEAVIVLQDSPTKISLQHLLMLNKTVIKHWRQDWEYQPSSMWNYIGNYQWQKVGLNANAAKGQWLQTVWQIDDSPRYASLGTWSSDHGVVAWTSENTYRPLPRRELTTRDDYDTLSGINRHALTADGWVHEQNNIKFDSKTQTPIVRELGLNKYQRVQQPVDFSPAYEYWKNNQSYWSTVRRSWDAVIQQNEIVGLRFTRQKETDTTAHYMHFINQAKTFVARKSAAEELESEVKKLLNQQLTVGSLK